MNDVDQEQTGALAEASDRPTTQSAPLDAAHRTSAANRSARLPKLKASKVAAGTAIGKVPAVLGKVKKLTPLVVGRYRWLNDEVHEHPRRALRVIVIVSLGLALVTGLLAWQASRYDATAMAREQAMLTAKDTVTEVLSYNFRTIERQLPDTQDLLTGKFKDDYVSLVRDVVTPTAKQTEVSIQTEVVNESVVSSKPDEVVLLLYVNQQTNKNTAQNPILTGSRLRVTLLKQDGKWRVSELTPV